MLVFNRKRGQGVVIGHNVEMTILEVRGDRVKVGFVGPMEVPIHRKEIEVQVGGSLPVEPVANCNCGRYDRRAG